MLRLRRNGPADSASEDPIDPGAGEVGPGPETLSGAPDFDVDDPFDRHRIDLSQIGPSGFEYLVAATTTLACVLLAGLSWGFLLASILFVGMVCCYAALAYERYEEARELSRNLSDAYQELEFEIDDRRQAEAVLRGYAKSLERQKAELERVRKEIEEASRAKIKFLANMSHEIHTPMNGIIGIAQLLAQTELSQEQRDYVGTIRTSADGLLLIVNDILDFSKIEAGKIELDTREFSPLACVNAVVELLFPRAHAKNLELSYVIDPRVPERMRGDSMRLRQVLMNLGGNAIKFTESGTVNLQVKVVGEGPGRKCLRFEVQDTGIGIDRDRCDGVFKPFVQGDPSTHARFGGTGLGLAISHQLVEMMGGRIEVESQPGRGSTFRFDVSLETVHDKPILEVDPALTGKRLLVIENGAVAREVVGTYASALGMEVEKATSGTEAQSLMERRVSEGRPFDVALIGHDLSDVPGLELAGRVKSNHRFQDTRLILINALGKTAGASTLVRHGFDAWVTKPVSGSKLHLALLHVVDQPDREAWIETSPPSRRIIQEESKVDTALDVLLVEGNVVDQKLTSLLLRKMGCRARVARDGEQALGCLEERPFDLILVDHHVAGMDVIETTRAILEAQLSARGSAPVIVMTANAEKDFVDRCLEGGASGFLFKPIQSRELRTVLNKWGRSAADRRGKPMRDQSSLGDTLDQGTLAALRELGGEEEPELFAELVRIFLEDTPPQLQELVEAADRGDLDTMGRIAHKLKSSSANLGANALSGLLRSIESATGADAGEVNPVIERALVEFDRVQKALRTEIG